MSFSTLSGWKVRMKLNSERKLEENEEDKILNEVGKQYLKDFKTSLYRLLCLPNPVVDITEAVDMHYLTLAQAYIYQPVLALRHEAANESSI